MQANKAIVLTRPTDQALILAHKIESIGGHAIHFPALEIHRHAPAPEALTALSGADIAIFISANAVEYGLRAAHNQLPSTVVLAAIGQATAEALRQRGLQPAIMPERGADSESLLATPALQDVTDKHIVIFRGVGGRETLRSTLCQRGAKVAYIECYTRRRPDVPVRQVEKLLQRDDIAAIHILSRETLENFCHIIGPKGQQRFKRTALFAPHPAVLEAARILGFSDVTVAGFGDDGTLAALQQRFFSAQAS